jgi:hypothetical protein
MIKAANGHMIGLTWEDGKTLNGKEADFFIGESRVKLFEDFINESLNEATTEFDFDPTTYAKGGITVVQGEDYLYGRVVGKNYTFSNKTKDVTLKVSRWKEGKEPNNYTAYLSVIGNSDKANKIANGLGVDLKSSGSIWNSNNTSSFQFSSHELSQKDLEKLLTNFRKL